MGLNTIIHLVDRRKILVPKLKIFFKSVKNPEKQFNLTLSSSKIIKDVI